MEAILAAGHEVGHHGYLHRGTDGLDASAQRGELEEGLAALGRLGVRPGGYRSPGWELTPGTLDLLGELGFSYDASLMADDRPYWVTSETRPLLELPGHWSLCDWPYFGWTAYHGGLLADPAAVERIWLSEFESARQDRRAVTYTMHPEAIGRGYLARMLDREPCPHPARRDPAGRMSRINSESETTSDLGLRALDCHLICDILPPPRHLGRSRKRMAGTSGRAHVSSLEGCQRGAGGDRVPGGCLYGHRESQRWLSTGWRLVVPRP